MDGLNAVLAGIERIGAQWMLGGSLAAMCYSEPRATLDADCIIALMPHHVDSIIAAFPENEFYVSPAAVLTHEIRRGAAGSFNIIHHVTGFKADCYPCGQDNLMLWGLAHSAQLPVDGTIRPVAPPEYIVVMKLRFFSLSGQDKHLRDIRSIIRLLPELNTALVEQWANRYGVLTAWQLARGSLR